MKGGYTEAELLAAEWSKQRKKQEDAGGKRRENTGSRSERDLESRRGKQYNDRDPAHGRHERRRLADSRDRFSSSRDTSRNDRFENRHSRDQFHRDDNHRSHIRDSSLTDNNRRAEVKIDIDEFGREILPGRTAPKKCRDSRSKSPPRGRSHSRSRSRSRSQSRLDSRSNARSWKHDKFDRDQSPEREDKRRQILQDYRPPSPTWISKAGGVAIMRKKLDD